MSKKYPYYICDYCDDHNNLCEEDDLSLDKHGNVTCHECYSNRDEEAVVDFDSLPKFKSPQTLEIENIGLLLFTVTLDAATYKEKYDGLKDKLKWRPLSEVPDGLYTIVFRYSDEKKSWSVATRSNNEGTWQAPWGFEVDADRDPHFFELPE